MENKHIITTFVDGKGTFSFQIKLSDKKRIDKETGYLYCDEAIFGHTGVQEYYGHEIGKGGNEIVKVHRMADEVFRDETMASFEGKSITVLHPSEAVTSKNYKQYDVGTILKVWRDGDNVVGNIVVKDMETIETILEKKMESLSLGYVAKLEPIADGEYKQKDILINHLAIVFRGRAVNARILDEAKKESKFMGLFNFLSGKKIKLHDEDTFTILDEENKSLEKKEDEEKEVEKKDVETKDEEEVEKKEKETKDKDDDEKEKVVQDDELKITQPNDLEEKGEVEMTDEMRKALKDELMAEVIKEIKENPEFKQNVFKDVVIKETQVSDEDQPKKLQLNFDKDEKLRKTYYDKLTNPMAHNGSWKEFTDFRKKAERKSVI